MDNIYLIVLVISSLLLSGYMLALTFTIKNDLLRMFNVIFSLILGMIGSTALVVLSGLELK